MQIAQVYGPTRTKWAGPSAESSHPPACSPRQAGVARRRSRAGRFRARADRRPSGPVASTRAPVRRHCCSVRPGRPDEPVAEIRTPGRTSRCGSGRGRPERPSARASERPEPSPLTAARSAPLDPGRATGGSGCRSRIRRWCARRCVARHRPCDRIRDRQRGHPQPSLPPLHERNENGTFTFFCFVVASASDCCVVSLPFVPVCACVMASRGCHCGGLGLWSQPHGFGSWAWSHARLRLVRASQPHGFGPYDRRDPRNLLLVTVVVVQRCRRDHGVLVLPHVLTGGIDVGGVRGRLGRVRLIDSGRGPVWRGAAATRLGAVAAEREQRQRGVDVLLLGRRLRVRRLVGAVVVRRRLVLVDRTGSRDRNRRPAAGWSWSMPWSVVLTFFANAFVSAWLSWLTAPPLAPQLRMLIGALTLTCLVDAVASPCWFVSLPFVASCDWAIGRRPARRGGPRLPATRRPGSGRPTGRCCCRCRRTPWYRPDWPG